MASESARRTIRYIDNVLERRLVRMADLRPAIGDTLPEFDRLGRQQPRRFGALTYANLCAEVGIGRKEVPGDFWTLTLTDDDFPSAEVACQCGETPNVEAMAPFVECGCGRWFFFDGEDVWAFKPASRTDVAPDHSETSVPS